MDLRDAIQRVALEWPSYGRRRITRELRRRGRAVNWKRVYRLMGEDNLLCVRKRKFVVTPDSNHGRRVCRVVIHKLTPFLNDERKGLQAGLSGMKEVDLLEIHVESALRYLSSIPQQNGTLKVDGYPVKRGTLLKLDRDSALLWVHGVSRAINPRLSCCQGKRRIPAPLVIRRHSSRSDLKTVGDEILGLSKMNRGNAPHYRRSAQAHSGPKRRGKAERSPARLVAIGREVDEEPARILKSYEVQAHRVEPIGVVYLWPISG